MEASEFYQHYQNLKNEMKKVIYGQDEIIDHILMGIFTSQHVLCTGLPGLGKTLLISTLGHCLGLDFKRIQFTPDLMPNDIIGFEILEEDPHTHQRQIKVIKGPIFGQIILADEINRTSPKTQSALLQAMQEREVSIGNHTYPLKEPFFVFATQNPIEQEGTYLLPEAQLDRFMFHLRVEYTSFADEIFMVKNTVSDDRIEVKKVLDAPTLLEIQKFVRTVQVTDTLIEKAVELVARTRPQDTRASAMTKRFVKYGAGPRAAQNLVKAARCLSLMRKKMTPDFEELKAVAFPVLDHRIILNFEALSEGIERPDFLKELIKEI